jgi:hypothetical protein
MHILHTLDNFKEENFNDHLAVIGILFSAKNDKENPFIKDLDLKIGIL